MGAHPPIASRDPPKAGPPGPSKTTSSLKEPQSGFNSPKSLCMKNWTFDPTKSHYPHFHTHRHSTSRQAKKLNQKV